MHESYQMAEFAAPEEAPSPTKFATASRELITSSPAGDRPSGRFDPLSTAHPKLIQQLQTGVEDKLEHLLRANDPWVHDHRDELLRKAASCGAFNCVRTLLPSCSGEGLHHAFVIAVTSKKSYTSNELLDRAKTIAVFETFFGSQYNEQRRVQNEITRLQNQVNELKVCLHPRMDMLLHLVRARLGKMGQPTVEGYRATLDMMAMLKYFLPKPRSALAVTTSTPQHPRGEGLTTRLSQSMGEDEMRAAQYAGATASRGCEADIRDLCLFLSKKGDRVRAEVSAPATAAIEYDQTASMSEAQPVELDIDRFAEVQRVLATEVEFNLLNHCEVHSYPDVEKTPTVVFNIIKADRSHCRVCGCSCCQHCIRRWHIPVERQQSMSPKVRKRLKHAKVCRVCVGKYSTVVSAAAGINGKAVEVHASSEFAAIRKRLLGGDAKFTRSFRSAPQTVGKMGGRSRHILMRTYDRQFFLKTLSVAERKMLAGEGTFLRDYKHHVMSYGRSLLTRYLGVFTVGRTDVVVMNNCLPLAHAKAHGSAFDEKWVFDLKGSTNNRANPGERVQKDLDFKQLFSSDANAPVFDPEDVIQLRRKIAADVMLLNRHNLMDYSLLVGFYKPQLGTPNERRWGKGVCRMRCMIGGEAFTACVAVVDLLQRYNRLKKIEHALKIFKHNISCVDAETYYKRFLRFLNSHLLRLHPSTSRLYGEDMPGGGWMQS